MTPTEYWTTIQRPSRLPPAEREAWHRDAWDREQTELNDLFKRAAAA